MEYSHKNAVYSITWNVTNKKWIQMENLKPVHLCLLFFFSHLVVIIYLTSCFSKPVWLPSFCGTWQLNSCWKPLNSIVFFRTVGFSGYHQRSSKIILCWTDGRKTQGWLNNARMCFLGELFIEVVQVPCFQSIRHVFLHLIYH